MLQTLVHLWWLWLIAVIGSGGWAMLCALSFLLGPMMRGGRGGSNELPGIKPALYILGMSGLLLIVSLIGAAAT